MGEMADLYDELVRSDDGCDHTARLVWKMNARRDMRNGVSVPMPPAPKVSVSRVEAKKKPQKRGYKHNAYKAIEKAGLRVKGVACGT